MPQSVAHRSVKSFYTFGSELQYALTFQNFFNFALFINATTDIIFSSFYRQRQSTDRVSGLPHHRHVCCSAYCHLQDLHSEAQEVPVRISLHHISCISMTVTSGFCLLVFLFWSVLLMRQIFSFTLHEYINITFFTKVTVML